jgi:hypothetical protein
LLAPSSGMPAMASLAVACFGSVDRALGLAAATFGEPDLAVAHLERAVETDLALGNRPCYAMSNAALADVLGATGNAGDRTRAVRFLRTAEETARACGMDRRADAWAARGDGTHDAECRREGRMWQVRVDGHTVVVPDSVGMRYLARLMASPGQEIAAVELAGQQPAPAARQTVLDERAIAAYRRRAGELQAEIDEAEDHCDLERAARAREEFDALVDEVKRATGLLGRARAFVDPAERARTSVQKALKRALSRIEGADAALGCELHHRVLTGTHCAFVPRD